MNPPTRPPPPKVLLVHDGSGYERHVKHLTDAGLRVAEAHADSAVAEAAAILPDLIVVDFDSDGDVTRQLKTYAPTQHIPIVALVGLMPAR